MKKTLTLWTLLLTTLAASSQNTEMRTVPPFRKLEIKSRATVYIRQDSDQSLKVSSDGPLDQVETRVTDNTLIVDGSGKGELVVVVPSLDGISISGKGEVIGQSLIKADRLNLDIGGDGKLMLQTEVQDLRSGISGYGKMTLSGTAGQANFDISGSGKVDATELHIHDCRINISGNGKCLVDVSDNLVIDISGNGSVQYKTEPRNNTQNISGNGRVSPMGLGTSMQPDTTKFNFGKSQVLIIDDGNYKHIGWKKSVKPVWAGFEMGFNNYVNSSGKFELPSEYSYLELREEKSVSVGLNLLQKNIELGHSNVWFFTGMGFTWNNWYFAQNVTLYPTTPLTATVDTTSGIYYIKSKLTASYLMVPLMFEAFTSRNAKKAFHIGAGAMLGLRLGSHTKQKLEQDGNVYKPKVFDEFGLNPFRAGARVAIGIHRLNLYAEYSFTPLFKSSAGPKLYPVNFGITLLGF